MKIFDERKIYYVYKLIRDDTNEVFYIGTGHGSRWHTIKCRNKTCRYIMDNFPWHSEIIANNISQEEGFKLEELEIAKYLELNCQLTNIQKGGYKPPTGYGKLNNNYGHFWTDEMKQQASSRFKENKSHAGARNGRSKRCMCVETGKIYDYLGDVTQDYKLKSAQSSVYMCLKDKRRTAAGVHFVGEDMFEKLSTQEERSQYLTSLCRLA